MKKTIIRQLAAVMLLSMLLTLLICFAMQISLTCREFERTSDELFWQIGQTLDKNETESEQIMQEFSENCLIRANAVAYIVEKQPGIIENRRELIKVAELLQVDEIHIFDKEGTLYAGTHPQYYGYTFRSGEQMRFFLPLLEDFSLQLCQDITPNTAEQKLMQYAAVWCEDRSVIVQIGVEPVRVLDALKQNEISYLFSRMTSDVDAVIFAVDRENGEILGCTDAEWLGMDAVQLGLVREDGKEKEGIYQTALNGRMSVCAMAEQGELFLVRAQDRNTVFGNTDRAMLLLAFSLLMLSLVNTAFMYTFLDRRIISGILSVNEKLDEVQKGNLEVEMPEDGLPEFRELGAHMNAVLNKLVYERDFDMLTGIYNRRAFYRTMDRLFASGEDLGLAALIVLDTDDLKKVNDTYGHEYGDRYLKAISGIWCAGKPEQTVLARLSGDEFVIFLYGYKTQRGLSYALQSLLKRDIKHTMEVEGGACMELRFSAGTAFYPEEGTDYHLLMGLADERMYEDKKKRKEEKGL